MRTMRSYVFLILVVLILGSCNQNMEVVRNGEPFSASPKPVAKAGNETPLAAAVSGGDLDVPPFVKAYFMQHFVAALYSTPQNFNPNPRWASPLKDP
jgi:hypothetical protein